MIVFWSWRISTEHPRNAGSDCFGCRQTLLPANVEDNLKLVTLKVMARINVEVIQAGYRLLDLDVHAMIRGRRHLLC